MEEFTIYYGTLPDGRIKIGVDHNYPSRIKIQKIVDGRILEVHDNVYTVSDRERELQRLYGVQVDRVPYHITYFNSKKESRSIAISIANKGKVRTAEFKDNMRDKMQGNKNAKGAIRTAEFKDNARDKMQGNKNSKGTIRTEETKVKMSEFQSKKTQCPHCLKEGQWRAMNRWHFDNCKHK